MERLPEFSANHPQLFIALGIIVALLVWSYIRTATQGFKGIGALETMQLINHENALVIDVRERKEMSVGKIMDSMHIPLGQVDSHLAKLQKHKDRPIVISCRTGARSSLACSKLVKQGFEKVYNLKGGIVAWQNANLPLEKS